MKVVYFMVYRLVFNRTLSIYGSSERTWTSFHHPNLNDSNRYSFTDVENIWQINGTTFNILYSNKKWRRYHVLRTNKIKKLILAMFSHIGIIHICIFFLAILRFCDFAILRFCDFAISRFIFRVGLQKSLDFPGWINKTDESGFFC